MWRCSDPEAKIGCQKGGYQKVKNGRPSNWRSLNRYTKVRRIIIKEITVNAAISIFQHSLRLVRHLYDASFPAMVDLSTISAICQLDI